MLAFLEDRFKQLEPGYVVSPRSMLGQNPDTRFSKDKSPYKTSVAMLHGLDQDEEKPRT
jgi:uncharacterized protein (DUF2461 family)